MRIGIVLLSNNESLKYLNTQMTNKLISEGHTVTNVAPKDDKLKLMGVQYIIFIVDSGKIFDKSKFKKLEDFIKSLSNITASYACLYTNVRPFILKTFVKYMEIIENSGFIIHESDTVGNNAEVNIVVDKFNPVVQ